MSTLEPLESQYASDPDMDELIDMFVARLPIQIHSMRESLKGDVHPDFVQSVHQLKGTGALVGFDPISQSAAIIQREYREVGRSPAELRDEIERLILLCRRARHWARSCRTSSG
ncbi:MAG: hypothetical protein CMH57_10835 [Myxococcales bacterium]|nr:hypothetical protein [Myxococcales bacterium]